MSDITFITPSSFDIKKKKLLSKSPMFIRIGPRGDNIFFSQSAVQAIGIKRFDKIVVAHQDDEFWLLKNVEGFPVTVDSRGVTRICDTSLAKWFIENFKQKAPFRLDVIYTNNSLYIKQKTTKCKHK